MRKRAQKTCVDCRYWSEMIAATSPSGQLTALCLQPDSHRSGAMTAENEVCEEWTELTDGSVDDPDKHHPDEYLQGQ